MIVCDANKLDILFEKADQCPTLKHVIKIGDVSKEDEENAEKLGINITSFNDVEVKMGVETKWESLWKYITYLFFILNVNIMF